MKKLRSLLSTAAIGATLAAALAGCAGTGMQAPALQPAPPGTVAAGKAEVLWLGQATMRITTPGGKVIVIDPWLSTNPKTPAQFKDLKALGKNPASDKEETHFGGVPVGYVIELENGFKIWHMGDTGLYGDMKLVGETYKPDLVLIPIGGHFTMGPRDAATAVRDMIKPRYAIPMHYGTFPLLSGTPAEFTAALGASATRVLVPEPGQKIDF